MFVNPRIAKRPQVVHTPTLNDEPSSRASNTSCFHRLCRYDTLIRVHKKDYMRCLSSSSPQASYTGIAACLPEFPQSYPQAVLRVNLRPHTVRERTSGEAGTGRSGRVSEVSDLLSGDPAIRHTRSAFSERDALVRAA